MARLQSLFATKLYRAQVSGRGSRRLLQDLSATCRSIASEDRAGQAWAKDNGYAGYTSYASLDDLVFRASAFGDLKEIIDGHVRRFTRSLDLDLEGRPVELDSLWINVLNSGGAHGSHLHPRSIISGTFYVEVPAGASALKLEDPRLGLMMAAPGRKPRARLDNRTFVSIEPKAGTLLLWESWLRHEVTANRARTPRISISFNYGWR
jgi:uncharacterized protein (TIGR02466 family)